jgi:hypothetical protein
MRRLRRAVSAIVGLPKEIIVGLLIIAVAATATGVLSSSPSHPPVAAPAPNPQAGGGGAFVPASTSTTPTTLAPTTTAPPATTATTTPPTTQPARTTTTQAPRTVTRSSTPSTTTPARTPAPAAAVGVYAGAGNPSGVAAFAGATGAHVTVAEDYLQGGSWNQIDGSGGTLNWMLGQWRGSGYRMVIGVPMFDNSGTDTLAQGAAGAYNSSFVTLAQTLVAGGQGGAMLRLGQEFTGSWNSWRVTDLADAQNYAAYYRQIVTSMRSVPGQAFKFIWEGADPQDGSYSGAYTAEDTYPGSAYVDYIGTDTYDQSWAGACGLAFNNTTTAAASECSWTTNTLPGLNRVADFAFLAGKPVVFPEWGLAIRGDGHGMGDDPTFVYDMASWMSAHDVAFDDYFNFDVSGQVDAITDGNFGASLAIYRDAVG